MGSGYGSKTVLGSPHIDYQLLFSEYCSISALSCSFEFLVVGGSQRLLSLNPTTFLVVLLLRLWLLLGSDNNKNNKKMSSFILPGYLAIS